eukprot:m.1077457 g.1077457  ORF g.1077457 m.1077457 type:complete len:481 (+) comp24251_c0_seq39:995-2437(+)
MWCLVVLHPDRLWEGCTVGLNHTLNVTKAFASPFSGGVFWDPADNMYKMWYRCNDGLQCYATSVDGIAWTKPMLDVVNGTNIVISERVDGATVWLDGQRNVPRSARFKMAAVFAYNDYRHYTILHSADGVHWIVVTNSTAGSIADRSTVFFNPFRSKWVYSIKQDLPPPFGRSRAYWEAEDLDTGATWGTPNGVAVYNWTNADEFDPPWGCGHENYTQLYNLDAVAYESVLVGLFSIFTGKYCADGAGFNRTGEWDSVFVAFSRDGFHWSRPVVNGQHPVFLPMDASVAPPWRWNKANVQSVGGGFTVQREGPMRFYVGARTGPDQLEGNASAGVAELRRDGFASVSAASAAPAVLTTHAIVFSGAELFVNLAWENATSPPQVGSASLAAEVLNATTGRALPGLTAAACLGPQGADNTRMHVQWANGVTLHSAVGRPVQFRFLLSPGVRLYAFWVAMDSGGASRGYLGAGGKGYAFVLDE